MVLLATTASAADVVLYDRLPWGTDFAEVEAAIEAEGATLELADAALPDLSEAKLAIVMPASDPLPAGELDALEAFYADGGALVVVSDYPSYLPGAADVQNALLERTDALSRWGDEGAVYASCGSTAEIESTHSLGAGVDALGYAAGDTIVPGAGAAPVARVGAELLVAQERGVVLVADTNVVQEIPCAFGAGQGAFFANLVRWACDQDDDGVDGPRCAGPDADDRDAAIGEPEPADTGTTDPDPTGTPGTSADPTTGSDPTTPAAATTEPTPQGKSCGCGSAGLGGTTLGAGVLAWAVRRRSITRICTVPANLAP